MPTSPMKPTSPSPADGVLSFKYSPDYEMPRDLAVIDAANINTYKVVVVASDDAPGAAVVDGADVRKKAYEKVTVMVTDVDEPGVVSLSAQQAQVNVELTATLTDDDATTEMQIDRRQVEVGAVLGRGWPVDSRSLLPTTSVYTPLGVEDKYLRVTATYDRWTWF